MESFSGDSGEKRNEENLRISHSYIRDTRSLTHYVGHFPSCHLARYTEFYWKTFVPFFVFVYEELMGLFSLLPLLF